MPRIVGPDATQSAGRLRASAEALDDLDTAIFAQLQKDARRAYRAIAEALGVPEGTVRFRVNRLVRDGIIHLTATIHPQRLGGVLATVLVRVELPNRQAAMDELRGWPEVMYLSSCTGHADLMLQVVTADLEDLNTLLTERLRRIDGIREVETLIELDVAKAHYEFPSSVRSRSRNSRRDLGGH